MILDATPRKGARRSAAWPILLTACLWMAPVPAFGQGIIYHVRTDGSDASCSGLVNTADPGTGAVPRSCAFRTPQAGVDHAGGGDSVLLHAGTYTQAGTTVQSLTDIVGLNRRTEFDSEDMRLTVKAAGDGPVIFDGGSSLDTGIVVWGTSFVTFEEIELRQFTGNLSPSFDWGASGVIVGSPGPSFPARRLHFQSLTVRQSTTTHSNGSFAEMAIWCSDCTGNEIHSAVIESVEPFAIALGHNAPTPLEGNGEVVDCLISHLREGQKWTGLLARRTNDWVLRRNYLTDATSSTSPLTDGVRVEDSTGWTIAENVFYRLPHAGLHLLDQSGDGDTIETHKILNNTADCADLASAKGLFAEGCTRCQVVNNIATNCQRGIETGGDTSGTLLGANGFFQDGSNYFTAGTGHTLAGSDLTADPRFQEALPRPDPWYRLKPESPAIDAGADDFCAVTPDDGHCDLGAFQADAPAQNQPPARPRIRLVDKVTGVSARLNGSDYSDPEGDNHAASQWQVDLAGGSFASPVYNSGRQTGSLLSLKAMGLASETDFISRVRYQDSQEAWSDWSDGSDPAAAFRTLVATAIPPKVVTVSPADGAVGVAADAFVTLTFNTPLDVSSVTDTSVRLLLKDSPAAQAPGSPHLSGDGLIVTMQPAGLLVPEAKYKVSAIGGAGGIRSRDGQIPGKNFASAFTVQSGVASSDPADGATGVSVSVAPSVTFLWAVDATTATATTVVLKDTSSGKKVPLTSVAVSLDGLTVIATPAAPLASGHKFALQVQSGSQGLKFADGRPLGKTVKRTFRTL